MKVTQENDIFLIAASRTDSVRYRPRHFRSLSELFAEAVNSLGSDVSNVDTVFITHRYPTPVQQAFDREDFLSRTHLPHGDKLTILSDNRSTLGGLAALDLVVNQLKRSKPSKILMVGGEVFQPQVWLHLSPSISETKKGKADDDPGHKSVMGRYQLAERRHLLSKFGGLSLKDKEIGLTPLSANALVADALFRECGFSKSEIEDLMCSISCHLEKYAFLNRHSYQHHADKAEMSESKYKNKYDRKLKWPFKLLDLCSISNGAGALIVTNDPSDSVHRVKISTCVVNKQYANSSLLDRPSIGHFEANREAWREIRDRLSVSLQRPQAGTRPVTIMELFDIYAYQIPLTLIEMGMYNSLHDVLRDFKRGYFDPWPDTSQKPFETISQNCGLILNPSGGSRDGHPNGGFALVKAAECFFRLTRIERGSEFALGLDDVQRAFVHTISGVGNTVGVLALEKCL